MKTFEELLNTDEPGWAVVQDWLESRSRRPVPIAELYGLQLDIARQLDGQEES